MYDWLDELAAEVVLAHLLGADLIPRDYAPSKETRAVKRGLRQRLFLVQLRTMVKDRIRALLSQYSIALPKLTDLFGRSGLA